MCLGVPGSVVRVEDSTAVVDFFGVRRAVSLDLLETADLEPGPDGQPALRAGDFVLVHVGFAIRRILPEDVEATLRFFAELAADTPEALEGLPGPPARPPESGE